MKYSTAVLALTVVTVAACGPKLQKISEQGDLIPEQSSAVIDRARADAQHAQAQQNAETQEVMSTALATCMPQHCEAISRGEVMIGMTPEQVLAATRTTRGVWSIRGDDIDGVFTPASMNNAPADAVAELAFVQFRGGAVSSYTYRETSGFRTVTDPSQTGVDARAAATADRLLAEGDNYMARGDLQGALNRYDRADVLRPNHGSTTLRIAQSLDKLLRPVEAALRYRKAIHEMELERIRVEGEAAAKLAEAIALARQRVTIIERTGGN